MCKFKRLVRNMGKKFIAISFLIHLLTTGQVFAHENIQEKKIPCSVSFSKDRPADAGTPQPYSMLMKFSIPAKFIENHFDIPSNTFRYPLPIYANLVSKNGTTYQVAAPLTVSTNSDGKIENIDKAVGSTVFEDSIHDKIDSCFIQF